MARLAGTFAGIVTVDVPPDRADSLRVAIGGLAGVLDTMVHVAAQEEQDDGGGFHLDLIGNDRPGIIREITGVLAAHQVSVEDLQTKVVSAPQAGGQLFAARAAVRAPAHTDTVALREALEQLAGELLVDISFDAEDINDWE